MRSARPAFSTACLNTPSAVGDRQMLPVHTKRTLTGLAGLPVTDHRSHSFKEQALLERLQLVPQLGGTLEFEIAGSFQHLLLEARHFAREPFLVHRGVALLRLRRLQLPACLVPVIDAVDDVLDALVDTFWRDARSEERRVGKECRFGWSPEHEQQ